jgi:hypothetical protein
LQQKLTRGPLLDTKGHLVEAGYHTALVKAYDRSAVKVKGLRIKEWDYYYVGNASYGVALTVADNDYLWLTSVTWFDFEQKKETSSTNIGWFPHGKLKMPESSDQGNVIFNQKNHAISYVLEGKNRHITATVKNFQKGVDLSLNLVLQPTIKDSMVIATPFFKPKHFYYNQKINLLKAKGYVKLGDQNHNFSDAYGVLDWGRGVWTYKNTWYWSSLSGIQNGQKIGFNLGYGFGDTSKATENMLFVNDRTFKLSDVVFNIPVINNHDDYMSPWIIQSDTKDIDLVFSPILDRHSNTNILILQSMQHQVFGYFSGTFKISETETLEIKEMIGFAEKVSNRW